jgi:HPt (histidine-containing phosphotransfer) domain-containing protein
MKDNVRFDEMMKELQQEYLDELPKKISAIRKHFADLNIEVLSEDFHKMKGTGRTYGLPEVSVLGGLIERLCQDQPQSVAEVLPSVIGLLEDIHQARARDKTTWPLETDARFTKILKIGNL